MSQDEYYNSIGKLTNEYVELTKQFIEATNKNKPASILSALKERIRIILAEIERLEDERSEKQ